MYLTYVVIGATILLMVVLIFKTEILKDMSTVLSPDQKPYSLARTQMALWTIIVFCCFVYLWGLQDMIINDKVKLGKTALILLGIGVSTVVLGKAIDETDKRNFAAGIGSSPHQNNPSQGFLLDILSDKDGISILRFQNVAFSIVLMISFVVTVMKTSVMPEFDETLLVLSGISSGGYLGIKMNENR